MFDLLNGATQAVGSTFAGRDYSAPTADAPPMCTPEDAGPLGFLGSVGQTIGDLGRGLSQEGIGGLLDPSGMLDRQQAQRDLSAQFDIMNPEDMVSRPGQPDNYAGNQVSPEEFQRIARTYSDIRLGRTNFEFSTSEMTPDDAGQYQSDMMGQFGRMMQTDSGRTLVNDIAYNDRDHHVTLGANYTTDAGGNRVLDPTNASANPTNEANAGNARIGSGSALEINPAVDNYNVGGPTDSWGQIRGDVALYHELSHARHQILGTEDQSGAVQAGENGLDGTPRDANRGNIQRWEHQAVGIGSHLGDTGPNENRYRRERAQIGAAGGPGIVTGDVGMTERAHYTKAPTPPPGP